MDCIRRWRIQGTVLTSGNASISTCPQHLQSWALNRISIFNYHLLHSIKAMASPAQLGLLVNQMHTLSLQTQCRSTYNTLGLFSPRVAVKSSFFNKALPGSQQDTTPPSNKHSYKHHTQHPHANPQQPKSPCPETFREIGKRVSKFPLSQSTFLALNLNLHLLSQHVSTPVAGRTALFLENWSKLIKDPWVLSAIRGYQIPLQHWPDKKHRSVITVIGCQTLRIRRNRSTLANNARAWTITGSILGGPHPPRELTVDWRTLASSPLTPLDWGTPARH